MKIKYDMFINVPYENKLKIVKLLNIIGIISFIHAVFWYIHGFVWYGIISLIPIWITITGNMAFKLSEIKSEHLQKSKCNYQGKTLNEKGDSTKD